MEAQQKIGLTEQAKPTNNKSDRPRSINKCVANALVFGLILLPQFAHADVGEALGGITQMLRTLVNLFIFEWGYYIGILALGYQGYRWKTGRISFMELGQWTVGIFLVFFAPNIVQGIRSSSGGSVT